MKTALFKTIDEAIFKQITAFRNSSFFEKVSEQVRDMSENEQLILNQIFNLSLYLIPIGILIGSIYFKYTLSSELGVKKDIHQKIISIKESKLKLSRLTSSTLPRISILEKRELVDNINNILARRNIAANKITVDNFSFANTGSTVQKIEASIKFKDITTVSFSNLLLDIQKKFKASIKDLDVAKNETSRLLYGTMSFTMFSKVNK